MSRMQRASYITFVLWGIQRCDGYSYKIRLMAPHGIARMSFITRHVVVGGEFKPICITSGVNKRHLKFGMF
jgi:hypothetical protein